MHSPQQRPTKPDLTPPSTPRPDVVQLRARRSPRLIALGVLLVVLGGLGAAALYSMNTDQRQVIVMASDVRRGEQIEPGDLRLVDLPGSTGIAALPADRFDSLLGQEALTDLPSGAFPLGSHVGTAPLPSGRTVVGLRLPLGKLPSADLPVGTVVRVVGLAEGDQSSVDALTASVPLALEDGMTFALEVTVADAEADAVARLAAGDLVAVVVVGQ